LDCIASAFVPFVNDLIHRKGNKYWGCFGIPVLLKSEFEDREGNERANNSLQKF
jgi:hypothetical protein